MQKGTFTDPFRTHPHLKGETAILIIGSDTVFAQFDNTAHSEASGWHQFNKGSFIIDPADDPWEAASSDMYADFAKMVEKQKKDWTGESGPTIHNPALGAGYDSERYRKD